MGGGPGLGQDASGETLYPFGSCICYFCGPSVEDCVTFDETGRVCPGHRGSRPPCLRRLTPPLAGRDGGPRSFRNKQAIAVAEALGKSSWRCPHSTTCGEWNLSFRAGCWKSPSKRGHAAEVVLGVPDPAAHEQSEGSEDEDQDRAERTSERIAEKVGLAQFLRRRGKRRGGKGRDRKPRLPQMAVVAAEAAPAALQDLLLVLLFWRWCRGVAQLLVPPQLPATRPPLAGRSFAGRRRGAAARGSSAAWQRPSPKAGPLPGPCETGLCTP